jgi:hypothetical protein
LRSDSFRFNCTPCPPFVPPSSLIPQEINRWLIYLLLGGEQGPHVLRVCPLTSTRL